MLNKNNIKFVLIKTHYFSKKYYEFFIYVLNLNNDKYHHSNNPIKVNPSKEKYHLIRLFISQYILFILLVHFTYYLRFRTLRIRFLCESFFLCSLFLFSPNNVEYHFEENLNLNVFQRNKIPPDLKNQFWLLFHDSSTSILNFQQCKI